MSRKMQVLFIKQTNHVLAAFTRVADPESKLKVEDLVGTALPVRAKTVIPSTTTPGPLFVPPESLDVAVVELEEEAFVTPSRFVASGTKLDSLGSIVPIQPNLAFDKITINAVTTPATVAANTKVWAQIQQITPPLGEEPIRRVVEGEIENGNSSVDLVLKSFPDKQPASIPAGSYYVLVLIAGMQPLFSEKTV